MTAIRDISPGRRQAAQDRGDIQKGLTGDKVPGFDPAAAPLETDAEAAGTPEASSAYDDPAMATPASNRDAHQSSHADAMRRFDGKQPHPSRRTTGIWWFLLGIVAALIVVILFVLRS